MLYSGKFAIGYKKTQPVWGLRRVGEVVISFFDRGTQDKAGHKGPVAAAFVEAEDVFDLVCLKVTDEIHPGTGSGNAVVFGHEFLGMVFPTEGHPAGFRKEPHLFLRDGFGSCQKLDRVPGAAPFSGCLFIIFHVSLFVHQKTPISFAISVFPRAHHLPHGTKE